MNGLKLVGAVSLIAGVLLVPAPSLAHHSFAAEFDAKNCADVTGVLTKGK